MLLIKFDFAFSSYPTFPQCNQNENIFNHALAEIAEITRTLHSTPIELFGFSITSTTLASNHIFAFQQYTLRLHSTNQIQSNQIIRKCNIVSVYVCIYWVQPHANMWLNHQVTELIRHHSHKRELGQDAMLVRMYTMMRGWKTFINATAILNFIHVEYN